MKKLIPILLLLIVTSIAAQDNKKDDKKKEDKNTKKANLPAGYESITWGTLLSKVKSSIKGKIQFTDEKTVIISKKSEITYKYGFFFIDPERIKVEKDKKKDLPNEGKLFFVALKFPSLPYEEVKKQIEKKFGPSTNENIINNQGSVAWNSDKTVLVLWVDRFENKKYCRRITYVSKDIAKEIDKYYKNLYFYKEQKTIENVLK